MRETEASNELPPPQPKERLQGLIRAGLLLGVWLVVFTASVLRPGVTLEPPWLALAGGGAVTVAAAGALPFLGVARKAVSALFFLALFLAWYLLAPWIGGTLDAYRTTVSQWLWVGFGGVFLATALALRSARAWRALAWGILGLANGLSLYGFWAYRQGGHERLLSTFVNADSYSLYPLASIFLGLGLFHRAGAQQRMVIHANTVAQLLALLLTGARASVVGLLVACATQAWLLFLRKARKGAHPVVETMAPLLMALFLLLLSSFFLLPGSQRWERLLSGGETQGVAMRRDVLLHGARAALQHPIFGSGPGTFALRYQEVRPLNEVPDRVYVNVAHNDYVELLVESGLPALILWGCLVLTVFDLVFRSMRRNPMAYELSGAAAAFIGILAYQLLNFAFPVFADLVLMALLLGMCACSIETAPEPPPQPRVRKLLWGFALLFGLAGLWTLQGSLRAQWGHRQATAGARALDLLDLEQAQTDYQKALQHLPGRAQWWLKLAEVQKLLAEIAPSDELANQVLASLEQAYRASPRQMEVFTAYARGLAEADKTDDALAILQSGVDRMSYFLALRRELVTLYLKKGDIFKAAETQLGLYHRDPETLKRTASLLAAAEIATPEATEKLLAQVPIELEALEPLIQETTRRLTSGKHFQPADRIQKVWGQLKGEDSCFWLERSTIWTQAKKPDMELKCLERAVEERNLSSTCYERALLRYVEVASAQGKAKTAEARLLAYVERGSAGSPAVATLARLQLNKGQLAACRKVIVSGLEQYPRDPHILVVRGELSLKEGFYESAREDAMDVLEIDGENREAKALLARLRSL